MNYDELVEQYNNLSEEDKNALLVYKSRLGLVMNDFDDNLQTTEIYNDYKYYLNDPKNLFIKMSVFKDIDFTSKDSFIFSLSKKKELVDKITSKIITKSNLTLYRAFSTLDDDIEDISKDNLISTTIDPGICAKFFTCYDNYKHFFFIIDIDENSPVAVCPYSIVNNSGVLTVKKDDNQEEIILNKDNYDFVKVDKRIRSSGEETITAIRVRAVAKEEFLNNQRKK